MENSNNQSILEGISAFLMFAAQTKAILTELVWFGAFFNDSIPKKKKKLKKLKIKNKNQKESDSISFGKSLLIDELSSKMGLINFH